MAKKLETTADSLSAEDYARNMELWDQVKATDPAMQKRVSFGKRNYTAVDPQWQLQQATKLWGPYGLKWGLTNIRCEFREVSQVDSRGEVSQQTVVILYADFVYPMNGEPVTFPIANDEKFKPGDDCLKKLITNTRSKALSWIGFSADVFMGKFDDAGYVKDLELKFGDQDAMVQKVLAAVKTAKDQDALDKCRERLQKMIADETIEDRTVAAQLLNEVSEREQELLAA